MQNVNAPFEMLQPCKMQMLVNYTMYVDKIYCIVQDHYIVTELKREFFSAGFDAIPSSLCTVRGHTLKGVSL